VNKTQHLGLGRRLVERACAIAREAGHTGLAVISSIGTRAYYRDLGFADGILYQHRAL
jgi:elongator complex protein 3